MSNPSHRSIIKALCGVSSPDTQTRTPSFPDPESADVEVLATGAIGLQNANPGGGCVFIDAGMNRTDNGGKSATVAAATCVGSGKQMMLVGGKMQLGPPVSGATHGHTRVGGPLFGRRKTKMEAKHDGHAANPGTHEERASQRWTHVDLNVTVSSAAGALTRPLHLMLKKSFGTLLVPTGASVQEKSIVSSTRVSTGSTRCASLESSTRKQTWEKNGDGSGGW